MERRDGAHLFFLPDGSYATGVERTSPSITFSQQRVEMRFFSPPRELMTYNYAALLLRKSGRHCVIGEYSDAMGKGKPFQQIEGNFRIYEDIDEKDQETLDYIAEGGQEVIEFMEEMEIGATQDDFVLHARYVMKVRAEQKLGIKIDIPSLRTN